MDSSETVVPPSVEETMQLMQKEQMLLNQKRLDLVNSLR